ncbi:hypothetical protein HAX54_025895 [Datura stramonium]|uniref:Uncharacterized protein n=1 Tax=Datura stramonium TaxID=4076 RepID=A0ABS8Y4X3_DATST|nr:hypothetical protein [Datura stramonium]
MGEGSGTSHFRVQSIVRVSLKVKRALADGKNAAAKGIDSKPSIASGDQVSHHTAHQLDLPQEPYVRTGLEKKRNHGTAPLAVKVACFKK